MTGNIIIFSKHCNQKAASLGYRTLSSKNFLYPPAAAYNRYKSTAVERMAGCLDIRVVAPLSLSASPRGRGWDEELWTSYLGWE